MTGCSQTYLKSREPRLEFYDKINRSAEGKQGKIVFTDGTIAKGVDIMVASDSIRWRAAQTGKRRAVDHASVQQLVFRNHNRGGISGLKVGTVLGGLAGSLLTPLLVPETGKKDPASYLLPGMGFGCLAGFTIGGIVGINEHFVFTPEKAKDR